VADIFPDEGLDVILGGFPKGVVPATLYVGLFTSSHGPSSVPPSSQVLAGGPANGYGEVQVAGWSTYARQPVQASQWGAAAAATIWGLVGRAVTGPQVTFPTATGIYNPTDPIVGYLIADALTGGHAVLYSNFDDLTPITVLAIGDTVKVTPKLGMGN
jgi:hypothetical protein